jgi:hypothetical protein
MNREDDEKLWELLGKAAEPKISPFFARNVLRQVRHQSRPASIKSWFRLRRLIPVSAMAAAVILALVLAREGAFQQNQVPNEPDPVAKIDPQDYEVVADLDELLASDENSLWDENSSL